MTRTTEQSAVLECARGIDQSLSGRPAPRPGDAKDGMKALAMAEAEKRKARRLAEESRQAKRAAAYVRLDEALPGALALHPFRDPDTIGKELREALFTGVLGASGASIDALVQKAVDDAYAIDRAKSLFDAARKLARKASIALVDGEPTVRTIIACDFDLDRWVSARGEDEKALFAGGRARELLSLANGAALFDPIGSDEGAPPFNALQDALRELRKRLPASLAESAVLARVAAVNGISLPDGAAVEAALEARRGEIKALKRRREEWDRSLVNAPATREALGASPTEFSRWVDDGRIPVAKMVPFYKWGRHLEATYHDPALFDGVRAAMPRWREEHAESVRQNRKKAALAAAGHDTRNVGDASLAQSRRLKALARSAAVEGATVVNGKVQPELVFPHALVLPLRLSEGVAAACAVTVVLSTPLGGACVAFVADKAPRGKARAEAVARIEAAAAGERGRLAEKLAEELVSWRARAIEAASGYPSDALPRIGASVFGLVRDFVAEGSVERICGLFRDALCRSVDVGMKMFLRRERVALIRTRTGLADYPALFPAARAIKRRLVLHVGPTNSGKTHAALDALSRSASGVYASPLRLMALEAYDRLNEERGVPCSMVTGEEVIEGARHVACTIETADFDRRIETAVIDEIQMLSDPDRGWAWTAALVGLPADTVIMTGSADAIPRVQAIAAMTGDDVEIKTFERLNPLVVESEPASLYDVRPGDAVIAFSRREIMRIREALNERGGAVSVVYGALGPEVRRAEARRFRDGETQILVASDAIGMGLNLPCARIIFSSLEKFDGFQVRPLTDSEIRQIAGRAGRYGHHESGRVGVVGKGGLTRIRDALSKAPERPRDVRAFVMPPFRAVREISEQQNTTKLRSILTYFANTVLDADPCLQPAYMAPPLAVADCIDASGLDLKTRFGYLGVPLDGRSPGDQTFLGEWAKKHAGNLPVAWNSSKRVNVPSSDNELQFLEARVKTLSMYMWLALKWPETYVSLEGASGERVACNGLIEQALKKKFLHRSCRECGSKLPKNHQHAICEDCYSSRRGFDCY